MQDGTEDGGEVEGHEQAVVIDQEGDDEAATFKIPSLNHILKQAMMAKKWEMPYAYVCARQSSQFEI